MFTKIFFSKLFKLVGIGIIGFFIFKYLQTYEVIVIEGSANDNTYKGYHSYNKPPVYTEFFLEILSDKELEKEIFLEGSQYNLKLLDKFGNTLETKNFNMPVLTQAHVECFCKVDPCSCPWPIIGEFRIRMKCSPQMAKVVLSDSKTKLSELSVEGSDKCVEVK